MKKKKSFDTLPLTLKDLPQAINGYRIYKDENSYTVVHADTAIKAIDMSGIKNPYKIERETLEKMSVIGEALKTPQDTAQESSEIGTTGAAVNEA